jgi:hypothetical protein
MIDQGTPIQQAKSMAIPKRWPLVNTLTSRNQLFNKDARIINGYAEKDPLTGEYGVEKRPGFAVTPNVLGSGLGQGMASGQVLYEGSSIWIGLGTSIVYITGGQLTVLATINGVLGDFNNLGAVNVAGNIARFLFIPESNQIIFNYGYGAILPGAAVAYVLNITGYTGFPFSGRPIYGMTTLFPGDSSGWPAGTVPGLVYLDGFVYVMDYTGTIWETANQNQVSGAGAWAGTAFISAAIENDFGVILAKQLIYVVAIKTWSTQFFYDAGNTTGSSLSPVPGAVYNFGCISADSFAELDGVLFWVTQSKEGTNKVVKINNLQAEFISTPAVERQLDLGNQNASFYATAYQHAGHEWYLITNTRTNVTMVYDIGEKLWYLWTDYQGNYYPIGARCIGPSDSEWSQAIITGNIYTMDGDYIYPNDYGNIVPVDIYTPNFDAGVDRIKYLSQMRFNADQDSGGKLWVRFSEDDYKSWNNYRQVDLGRIRPLLNDEGSFYRRAYHFRHYADKPLRIRSVDLQMDIGIL